MPYCMKRIVGLLLATVAIAWQARADEKITFNEHIRPILSDNCFACHGTDAAQRKGKLRLDTAEGATMPRKSGDAVIIPGNLEDSEVWFRITSTDPEEVMPPADSHKPPLKPAQLALIKRWIEQGAVYQNHWAYEPVARPTPPPASGGARDHPVDRFTGAKLAERKLKLAAAAAPEILIRRLHLDLTGLPPTPEDVDAFLADRTPGAYEREVDRLLASARYG